MAEVAQCTDKRIQMLVEHFEEKVEQGDIYFKSRYIAEELG